MTLKQKLAARAEYQRKYYAEHKDAMWEYNKLYFRTYNNLPKQKQYRADYYQLNKSHIKSRVRQYQIDHPQEYRECQDRYNTRRRELRRLHKVG